MTLHDENPYWIAAPRAILQGACKLVLFSIAVVLFFCDSVSAVSGFSSQYDIDSQAFDHANQRIESLNFEECTRPISSQRVLYLLGHYQECLLHFLYESEDEQRYLEGMRELFYRSSKALYGCLYAVDGLTRYQFTDASLLSDNVRLDYRGHTCECFYNTFKSNSRWSAEERKALYRYEEQHYLRDAEVDVKVWTHGTLDKLIPNTIYNFVLQPDEIVKYSEERPGARQYHVATDGAVSERFTHPNHTILAGSANQIVVTAGAFYFVEQDNKRIYFVSNKSGHYRPYLNSLEEFRHWLGRMGVDEATVVLLPDLEIPKLLVEHYDATFCADIPDCRRFLDNSNSNGIPIALNEDEAAQLLAFSHRQWLHIDEDINHTFIEALAQGDTTVLTTEAISALNVAREQLNRMRSAYILLLEPHQAPHHFDRLVRGLGKLKDAIHYQVSVSIVSEAQEVLEALKANDRSAVDDSLTISNEESFYRFMKDLTIRIDDLRNRSELEMGQFHELKKSIRDVATLFQLLAEGPVPVEKKSTLFYRAVAEAFLSINDEMGVIHDHYVGACLRGEMNGDAYVVLSPQLAARISRCLGYVSLEPPMIDLELTQLSAHQLLHATWSTWIVAHGFYFAKYGVWDGRGRPTDEYPHLFRLLVTTREAADAMARMCDIFLHEQLAVEGPRWYINVVDSILATSSGRTLQFLEIPADVMMSLNKERVVLELLSFESLAEVSYEKMTSTLPHLLSGVSCLSTQESMSINQVKAIYDQVISLEVLIDNIKKECYGCKQHRYEVYDSLCRTLSALLAQLENQIRVHHRSNLSDPVLISLETRRLANKVGGKIRLLTAKL